jgi:hypothetical protein
MDIGDKIIIRDTREKFLNPGGENLTKPMKIVEELQILDSIYNIKFRFGSKKISKTIKKNLSKKNFSSTS